MQVAPGCVGAPSQASQVKDEIYSVQLSLTCWAWFGLYLTSAVWPFLTYTVSLEVLAALALGTLFTMKCFQG